MTRWSPKKGDPEKSSNAGKKRAGYEAGPSVWGEHESAAYYRKSLVPGPTIGTGQQRLPVRC
jgi:hypothetical protein